MKKYKIIKNFLTESNFQNLKETLTNGMFPWYRQKGIATVDLSDAADCMFTHLFYENNQVNSPQYKDLDILVKKLMDGVEGRALIRIKANFYPRTSKIIEHDYHVDYDFKHKTLILSINTNNGYTKFQDGTKVKSIENQVVKFDSPLRHKSTSCSDIFGRINIGVNYI